ncbi:apolipoprotein D and lipocalin family protein [Bosea sp. BE271]|nr:apolipoprotein D and lipocalin family protein [Bosea robiniae]MDR6898066.1 apolipoprotein D and lipocalin family protein [Bosea sp. BE109]MDR7141427.1 apolipoprotein D and lipocalin family protein [Bosea sp. BE168]MDR7178125.1 apolipoprotein D and lipocalin family protein [Bosea sp. BE271]
MGFHPSKARLPGQLLTVALSASRGALQSILLTAVATISLAGCAGNSMTEAQKAPEPRKRIDIQRFYTGTWREIARRPMTITDGCVAGGTEYRPGRSAGIQVLDFCRMGNPRGELKTIGGPGTILDPGFNAKLRVDYKLYGFVPVQRDYWVLDRADNYSWFISADPTLRDLYIFTRDPQISPVQRKRLVARAAALGYDVGKLEFPEQPNARPD